ncbi:helix-turn-helix domain-containing protein [Streptomyces sp. IB2014 011-1]|uniref:helix-turn-helix domain-containing protein n=1 Tax=Streptomyces sp. IB2014 011-1 TaxID=1844478 RepID=UPI000978F4A7|nr:helix-turn-helix transcriptional regulator [Streptomyces sp. IB2014 011-1]ONI48498.1 HTH-type transcriptional repressor RghR [Streptomyces sp. IB2014 011-1]
MSPSSGISQFLAGQLRAQREARGWSCDQLAVVAGINAATVRTAEGGTSRPSPRVVQALAAALGVPVEQLAPFEGVLTLRELRARRGLTQRDVAARVGVSTGMVSKVERGIHGVKEPGTWAASYGVSRTSWTEAWEAGRERQRQRIKAQRPVDGAAG